MSRRSAAIGMRATAVVRTGVLLALLVASGCTRAPSLTLPDGATLDPGRGLGPVTLWTPLADVLAQQPRGRVEVLTFDDGIGLELVYAGPSVRLRFGPDEACRRALGRDSAAGLAALLRDAEALGAVPACASLPLVGVAAEGADAPPTREGLRIGATFADLGRLYGPAPTPPPPSVAGERADDGRYRVLGYDGLVVYLGPPDGAGRVTGGNAGAAGGEAAGANAVGTDAPARDPFASWVVRRLVVVPRVAP